MIFESYIALKFPISKPNLGFLMVMATNYNGVKHLSVVGGNKMSFEDQVNSSLILTKCQFLNFWMASIGYISIHDHWILMTFSNPLGLNLLKISHAFIFYHQVGIFLAKKQNVDKMWVFNNLEDFKYSRTGCVVSYFLFQSMLKIAFASWHHY